MPLLCGLAPDSQPRLFQAFLRTRPACGREGLARCYAPAPLRLGWGHMRRLLASSALDEGQVAFDKFS
jgi:hypothetical protein